MPEATRWDAAAYETAAVVQLAWGRKVLARRKWRGDETVIDVGCGPGTLTAELGAKVPRGRIVAVDNDPSMIERARQTLARFGDRVRVVESDITQLAGIEPADVIFSNAVIHWIHDHDALYETFLHHLRPGGMLLAQCGGEGNLAAARRVASEIMKTTAFEGYFHEWRSPWKYEDDASTQERLLIAGFADPEVTLEAAPTPFADRGAFETFLRAVVMRPYLQALPDETVRNRFMQSFLERVEASNRGYVLDYVRLNVTATRPPHG